MEKRKGTRFDKNDAANDALAESKELERSMKRSLGLLAKGSQEVSERFELPVQSVKNVQGRAIPLLPKDMRPKPVCKVPSAGTRDSARELKKSKQKLRKVASFVRKAKKR